MTGTLRFAIRTPHEAVFEGPLTSLRVPTESGEVGIRPRSEPMVLAVEPGLILLWEGEGRRFAATAGGLLQNARFQGTLYTPFGVVGPTPGDLLEALHRALETPDPELAARQRLETLEKQILGELVGRSRTGGIGHGVGKRP